MFICIFFRKVFIFKNPWFLKVVKIKRRVVLHGQSTLTISLPASWVKKFGIKKGDELDLEELGEELRINTNSKQDLKRKHVDVKNLKRLGKTYISGSYRQGYNEISLNYNNSNYIKTIQEILSRELTGFEIIKQNSNSCLIEDLTGQNKDEFNNVLRRIWLLIIDLSRESLNAFREKKVSALKEIYLMDYSINKFSNYCLRLLIRKGHPDFEKTTLYYHLVKSLEEIADCYKDLCTFYSGNTKKIDEELIVIFGRINEHLEELYNLFYKYDEQKTEDLFKRAKRTYNKISSSKNDTAYCLISVYEKIKNLLSLLVEINL